MHIILGLLQGGDATMELPDFLKDETSRSILTWLGTGIATVVCAAWAVYKFRSTREKPRREATVSARNGSISAGRDIRENSIEIHPNGKH